MQNFVYDLKDLLHKIFYSNSRNATENLNTAERLARRWAEFCVLPNRPTSCNLP